MGKVILGIMVEHRNDSAEKIQELLTKYGCYIKTRIGTHQHADQNCTEKGLILLEMTDNSDEEADILKNLLTMISGVTVKEMIFE